MSRLLLEVDDAVRLIRDHDAEAAGFFHGNGHDGDSDICFVGFVIVQHDLIVHLVDMVAGKNEDIVRIVSINEFNVLEDGVCGTAVPVASLRALIGSQQSYTADIAVQIPRNTDTDMRVQAQRLVLCKNTDRVDTGIDAVAQRKVNNAVLSAERNCRLSDLLSQNTETAALTACKKHGNHFLLNHDITSQ